MDYEQHLKNWILKFLSEPQENLNGLPVCPFAKKSLLEEKIKFSKSDDYVKDITDLFNDWNDQYDVVIFVVPDSVDKDLFVEDVKKINSRYLSKGFVCLEDHKDIPEIFLNLKFNNGLFNIILCQKADKINQASIILSKKGYYKNWSKELYDDVVSWRFFPTSS